MSNDTPQDPDHRERYGKMPSPQDEPSGGHPSMPDPTAEVSDSASATSAPSSITTAARLMYARAAIILLGMVLSIADTESIRTSIVKTLKTRGTKYTSTELDQAVTVAVISLIVFGLICIGLWILLGRTNTAGRRWARVLATVFGVLNLVWNLLGATQSTSSAVARALAALSIVLVAVALFLLWRRESSEYYAARSGPRG